MAGLNLSKPGPRRVSDLLYALHAFFEDEADADKRSTAQRKWLVRLSAYGYLKHSVDDPGRTPPTSSTNAAERGKTADQEPR